MGVVVLAVDGALASWVAQGGFLRQATALTVVIGVGMATLAGAALALRIREFSDAVGLVSRRLRRRAR